MKNELTAGVMQPWVEDFFQDPFMRRGTEEATDLTLTPEPMSRNEARQATDEAVRDMQSGFRKLLDIKRREGWRALGYGSWKSYVEKEFSTFRQGIDRKVAAESVREELDLADAPVSALKLGDSHLLLLSDVKGAESKMEVIERAKEIAENAPEPVGKAALFHKKGKITTAHIKQAIEDVQQIVAPNPQGQEDIDWMFSSGKEALERLRQERATVCNVQQIVAPTPVLIADGSDDPAVIAYNRALQAGAMGLVIDRIATSPEAVCVLMTEKETGRKFTIYLERYQL